MFYGIQILRVCEENQALNCEIRNERDNLLFGHCARLLFWFGEQTENNN